MTAQQLLRLYPSAWRSRYGEEFVEVIGAGNLSVQQAIDIVAGAVDAWMSPRVRASVRGSASEVGNGGRGMGAAMIQELKMKCATTAPRYTTKDALISAGVLLLASIVLVAAGTYARRQGFGDLGETLVGLAFPVSLIVSMPFMYLKGQSRLVQTVFVVVPLAILAAIGYLNTRI